MEYLKLIGIIIIIGGFALKLDTIFTIVLAGFITALISGIMPIRFLELLGKAFVENRLVTLFILTLPIIGICEANGLKKQAVSLINNMKGLTTAKFLNLYLLIRELAGLFSIRLGGHPQFVRPLVQPMAEAAFVNTHGDISEVNKEKIKARSAMMENIGNFFAQNTFVGASGVLLITGTLENLNYPVSNAAIAKASIPVALIALILGVVMNAISEKQMKSKTKRGHNGTIF